MMKADPERLSVDPLNIAVGAMLIYKTSIRDE